jgi:CRP-like cAMP-binding protein
MQMTSTKRFDDSAAAYETGRGARHPLREIDGMSRTSRYALDERICTEGRNCEYWHRVVAGAARRLILRSDGVRQTIDLLAPGDYFGFFVPDDRGFVVEAAADDTIVSLYPRWCVEFLAEVDPATRQALRDLEIEAISRTRLHFFLGRRMTAAAKVSSILIDLESRSRCEYSGWFELPISLAEIADYLDLSPATVNWFLALLAGRGIIARVGDRRIRILDRDALRDSEIVLTAAERSRWLPASEEPGVRRDRQILLDQAGEATSGYVF